MRSTLLAIFAIAAMTVPVYAQNVEKSAQVEKSASESKRQPPTVIRGIDCDGDCKSSKEVTILRGPSRAHQEQPSR